MTEGFILAMLGVLEAVLTSVVTFLLTKRKYRAEVKGNEIENEGLKKDNDLKDLHFYIEMIEDNKEKLTEYRLENKDLRNENSELRHEIQEIRSVVFSMLQQICTDMMCQNRQFDKLSCPYYDTLFNISKEETENETE